MPQFWLEDFAPQLIWLVISFVLLYFLMARVALPRITDVLEDRHSRMADDIDQAEQLKANAEKVMADYQAALDVARAKAQATIAETVARLHEEADKRNVEVNEKLGAEAMAAAERIDAAKQLALGEMRGVAADLARIVCEKLTGATPSDDQVEQAVSTAAQGMA